jgi:hypothetical protein
MRYSHNSVDTQSDLVAAHAATHGHYGGGTRQIVAARTLIHRFRCGNKTAAL